MLNRAQAWQHIGEKLLNARRIESGICAEISRLTAAEMIDYDTERAMKAQLKPHLRAAEEAGIMPGVYLYSGYSGDFWSSGIGRFHEERAMGCFWLALEAEEEASQL